jgi:hypothetical protein
MTEDQEEKKDEQQEVDSFLEWVNELEEAEQPTCNIENPEDCEACGS